MKLHQLLAVLLAGFLAFAGGCSRRMIVYELPEGFSGWVKIRYDDPKCVDRPRSGRLVIAVDENGEGCSRNWEGPGALTYVGYFYVDQAGKRLQELKSTGWGEGGKVWAQQSSPSEKLARFFVGSEEEFKNSPGPYRNTTPSASN